VCIKLYLDSIQSLYIYYYYNITFLVNFLKLLINLKQDIELKLKKIYVHDLKIKYLIELKSKRNLD